MAGASGSSLKDRGMPRLVSLSLTMPLNPCGDGPEAVATAAHLKRELARAGWQLVALEQLAPQG